MKKNSSFPNFLDKKVNKGGNFMNLNLKKIMSSMKKNLSKEWGKIDFDYKLEKDELTISANLTLNNHDDDIQVAINIYEGGGSNFRAIFDKLEKTEYTYKLVNEFNDDDPFFKAFIRNDGYLELTNFFICYEPDQLEAYGNEFLLRLAELADNEILKQLTRLTH